MQRAGESYTRAAKTLEDDWDVIVIGSGIGGLATAALLGQYADLRVLVLEQHYVAGGFCHSFARPGFDWDVGIHYIGDVHDAHLPTRRLFDMVTGGSVHWEHMGEVYDRIFIGEDVYDYRTGLRSWRAQMVEYFPDDAQAIDNYINAVKEVTGASRTFYAEKALPDLLSRTAGVAMRRPFARLAARTTKEVLDGLTDNTRLKAVLAGQWGDYGLPPSRSSFAMHALVTNHYFKGGSYPIGGASVIPAGAEQVINKHGGRVLVGAEVDQIVIRDGKATGVRMADGRELGAAKVVSNAGVFTTYERLLDREDARAVGADKLLDTVERSVGHLSLYLGLDISTEDMGLLKPNLWLYPGEDHDAQTAAYEADMTQPFPLVYASFPSAKDPDFEQRHPGHSTIDVITLGRHEWFAEWDGSRWKKRGEGYDELKDQLRERMISAIEPHVPGVREHIAYDELSTPLTTQHFAGFGKGELYGVSHSADRFAQRWMRPRTPISGLYLTGADTMTAGVGSALFSGAITASAMAGRDLLAHAIKARIPALPRRG